MNNNKDRKKILHLITGLEFGGGAENMLSQLIPEMKDDLDNRGWVIRGRGEIGKKIEKKGVRVDYLNFGDFFDFGGILRYRRVLREFQPDIQVNYLIHADIFGRIFGKIFGIKKIVSYIRNIHRKKRCWMFLDRITLPLANFVLTNSETSKQYYIDKMGVKENGIRCIPNGIAVSKFENLKVNTSEKKKGIGIAENAFVIGTVARLEKQKDITTLIRAFKIVNKKNINTHLLIVGHGSQKKNLEKFAEDSGVRSSVTMLEKRTDVLELISIMNIFVLPSLNEGLSNALLEAMALGRTIVVSDIEENKELIEDKIDGLNFKCGDAEQLGGEIVEIMENRYDLEMMKLNAMKKVKEKYNLTVVRRELSNFLNNL